MKKLVPLLACLVALVASCSLFFGEKRAVSITVQHLQTALESNDGVGEDWLAPAYLVNGQALASGQSATVECTTWDNLIINAQHEESDDAYPDVGSKEYKEAVYSLIKRQGLSGGLTLYTTVYERRGTTIGPDAATAVWKDSFMVTITYQD